VTLSLGDRFELPVPRRAWESRRIPLAGGFRHLLDPSGEPIPVTLRGEAGQYALGVWDGGRGLLDVPGLPELAFVAGRSGRLTLEVEEVQAPTFRLGRAGGAPEENPVDPSPREIGGVRVRFDPSDAEILSELAEGAHAPLEAYQLNRWAHTIALTPGFEELISLASLREVVPYEHQLAAVKTVLNRMRGRALLADEVGLGKTVEAGTVLSELLRRRLARRVLVLVAPGLVTQWQEELRRKFYLDFVTHDAEPFRQEGPEAWSRFERVVASFHTAKRPEHARAIVQIPYDVVIVDEAHHLRNARTVLWQFVNRLRRTYLLLLTATPVQNDLEELFNLVTLLQPGQLKTLRAFRRDHVARGDKRLPRDPEGLRRLLSEVMVRNRRATTPVALTRRVARTILVEPTAAEQELYLGLSDFLRAHYRRGSGISRMMVQTLQMELGSSPMAAALTLERLLAQDQREPLVRKGLHRFLVQARSVADDAKSRTLLTLLRSWGDKLLIFTRFRATQEHLARRLREAGEPCGLYHGGLARREKEEAIRAFEGPCRILISTEAGGEGRNLQFAHGLVNYDLPWNPMRIEQRIGRLSRVGQTRDVHVFNLVAPGTIEETLLEILDAKINMFELVIGEIDMILGQLATDQDFEELVTDLWLASEDREAFRVKMESLGEQLLSAKQAYLGIRELDDRIFGDALAPGVGT
jgi:SNF2 family DNA or RNA helicase